MTETPAPGRRNPPSDRTEEVPAARTAIGEARETLEGLVERAEKFTDEVVPEAQEGTTP